MNETATPQIYVVNADGTDLTRLTGNDDLWHFEPVSSPDGTKIAYESSEDLFVVSADGTVESSLQTTVNRQPI